MYFDLNILEGSGIQFLKDQILIQISYWVSFIHVIVQLMNG